MKTAAPASLTAHVAPLEFGAHVIGAGFVGDAFLAATSEGDVHRVVLGPQTVVAAHPGGAVLCAALSPQGLITGGDDGRVVLTGTAGEPLELWRDAKRRWIDAVAAGPDGATAFATGKDVHTRDGKGMLRGMTAQSTPQGLCFAPKGYRLAMAQNGGALLWFPNAQTAPEFLEWKGSHLDVSWSRDGRFIVTSMQENALHGWRLGTAGDKPGHMRMTGYAAKPRSVSWSHDGLWLATSGADAAVVWPFQGDGPMGKAPRECGVRQAKVAQVAFHPNAYVLAVGYEDGCILMIRLTDASELLVRPFIKGSAVTAMGWDKGGRRLGFGCADGAGGILTLP